jgi:hypothetical protein
MGVAVSDKFVQQARQALLESVYQRIELIASFKGEFVHALDPYATLVMAVARTLSGLRVRCPTDASREKNFTASAGHLLIRIGPPQDEWESTQCMPRNQPR